MIDKFVRSVAEALDGIKDGSTVLIAGFAQVGEPRALIDGLIEQGAKDLVVVHNTAGRVSRGRGAADRRAPGAQDRVQLRAQPRLGAVRGGLRGRADRAGDRAAGHDGRAHPRRRRRHPGLLHRHRGRHEARPGQGSADVRRCFEGREYILEHAIRGDVALVEAWRADRWGNLVYRDAGRNFNPVMAAAAELTIAQTQHIAELGELSPEEIATPGIYVDRLVHVEAGDPPLKT